MTPDQLAKRVAILAATDEHYRTLAATAADARALALADLAAAVGPSEAGRRITPSRSASAITKALRRAEEVRADPARLARALTFQPDE